jgi:hypothetical protein
MPTSVYIGLNPFNFRLVESNFMTQNDTKHNQHVASDRVTYITSSERVVAG